jgi:hypothetical protein
VVANERTGKSHWRWWAFLGVVGFLAVVTGVAGLFGGLRAQADGPGHVAAGHTVDQGLFKVQVLDARAGRIKTSSFETSPQNLLVVRMRVTNMGPRTWGVSTFLWGLSGVPKSGGYVDADMMKSLGNAKGFHTSSIHPRLPVEVEAVWVMPPDDAPSKVTVALRKWDYSQSFTTDTFEWSVSKKSPIAALVTVPVRLGATS